MENNRPWLITLSVLVIFVVLGGLGLYISQNIQVNGLRHEITSAVNQLSAQIGELKTQPVINQSTSATPSSAAADVPVAAIVPPTANGSQTILKGWLEGTISPLNLVLAETSATFSGYSGNKFALIFSKNSLCTLAETESKFFCVNLSEKWLGVGDRVRVYGLINDGRITVDKLEVVSNLPLNQW